MSALHPIRPCAEFPNDNTELHAGSRWLSEHPSSPLTALLPDVPGVVFDAAPLPAASHLTADMHVARDAPDATIAVLEQHALDATNVPHVVLSPELTSPELMSDECASVDSTSQDNTYSELESELDLADLYDPFLAELAPFVEQMERAPFAAAYVDETPTQKLKPINQEPALIPVNQAVQPLMPLHFELTPLPPETLQWSQLTTVLSDHLLTLGHTRAAALMTPLLNAELVDLSRLEAKVIDRLLRDGIACARGNRVVSSPTFRSSAHVFREELANGGLDANEALFWLAQLVGSLTGDEHDALEETLRKLGIADLLEHAA
jgi:hypothetical protein